MRKKRNDNLIMWYLSVTLARAKEKTEQTVTYKKKKDEEENDEILQNNNCGNPHET